MMHSETSLDFWDPVEKDFFFFSPTGEKEDVKGNLTVGPSLMLE